MAEHVEVKPELLAGDDEALGQELARLMKEPWEDLGESERREMRTAAKTLFCIGRVAALKEVVEGAGMQVATAGLKMSDKKKEST